MALAATLALCACAIPGGPRSNGPADWAGLPLSWEKLDTIELWLEGSGRRAPESERLEGRLTLAEGRLEFAKLDHESDPGAPIEARLLSATRGFEAVLAAEDLSPDQRRRAEAGLSAVASVRVRPAVLPRTATIIPRSRWGAVEGVSQRMTTASQNWRRITLHHTAEASSHLIGQPASATADVLRLTQRYHMSSAVAGGPWGDIGYHFLIDPEGRVFEGRRLAFQGAHATGSNNIDNIGVCLLGHFVHERPTPRALAALESLLGDLRSTYRIPASQVFGHEHFKNTECPGPALARWLDQYKARSANVTYAR